VFDAIKRRSAQLSFVGNGASCDVRKSRHICDEVQAILRSGLRVPVRGCLPGRSAVSTCPGRVKPAVPAASTNIELDRSCQPPHSKSSPRKFVSNCGAMHLRRRLGIK
jgi:hypothetical protein